MTFQEQIKIDIMALIEELEQYRNMNTIYCTELRDTITSFDLSKISFCLERIKEWFEERYSENELDNISDYKKIKEILFAVILKKIDEDKAVRESIPLTQFWTAFKTWLDDESQSPDKLFKVKYHDSYSDFGNWYTVANVDNDFLYKSTYGKPYVEITNQNISIKAIKEYIEAYYLEIIEPTKGRLQFTVKVNELLARFKLPYKLQKGKLTLIGYKTTYKIDKIENYEQFERKIEYAAEMVMHDEFIDKHCALKYIADAFCYFSSLYKKDSDKKLGKLANPNDNTRVYKAIKDEAHYIRNIINDEFDIRHNEENSAPQNGQNSKREVLIDPIFTEYLYNRINSLLTFLRAKRNQQNKALKTSHNTVQEVDDEDLPF